MEKIISKYFDECMTDDGISEMLYEASDIKYQAEFIVKAYCMSQYMLLSQYANDIDCINMFVASPMLNIYFKEAVMNCLRGLDIWEEHVEGIYHEFCENNENHAQKFFWVGVRNVLEIEQLIEEEKNTALFLASYHESTALAKYKSFLREVAKRHITVDDLMEATLEAEEEMDNLWIETLDKLLDGIDF